MLSSGIIEIDVHGMRVEEAISAVQRKVASAGAGVYRVRVIHGFNGGTRIREALREEFSYCRDDKVKRVTMGDNQGVTDLILREY